MQQPLLRELLGIPDVSHTSNILTVNNSGGSANFDLGVKMAGGLQVAELSGGRINFLWRVSGPKRDLVLKYAAPFVRSIGPEFRLSQTRLGVEAEAMAAAHTVCPQHVPALLLYDSAASVLVQELVSGPQGCRCVKLVDALAPRNKQHGIVDTAIIVCALPRTAPEAAVAPPPPPRLAADLASLLAGYLLRNSVYALPYEQHSAAVERLRNSEVVAVNAAVVFTDPWNAECTRNRVPPGLEGEVARLRSDAAVRQEVSRLLDLYLGSSEALIHNDLTASNILVPDGWDGRARGGGEEEAAGEEAAETTTTGLAISTPAPDAPDAPAAAAEGDGGGYASETYLIDWEFATYGPMAYDIGSLLGNLLLSYCATCCCNNGRGTAGWHAGLLMEAAELRDEAAATSPLLRCVVEIWEELEMQIRSYTPQQNFGAFGGGGGTEATSRTSLGAAFAQRVLSDSLGYAGSVMSRLLFGMHNYPALEALPCARRRRAAQRLALRLATALLRPGDRAARGWDRPLGVAVRVGVAVPSRCADRAGSGRDGGSGIRQLVRDVELWAAEAEERAAAEEGCETKVVDGNGVYGVYS